MSANQLRLSSAGCTYVPMHALRRLGPKGTELEWAQATTIRLKSLKIGAQIRITVPKVWLSMATSYPRQVLFGQSVGAVALLSREGGPEGQNPKSD